MVALYSFILWLQSIWIILTQELYKNFSLYNESFLVFTEDALAKKSQTITREIIKTAFPILCNAKKIIAQITTGKCKL